MRFKLSKYIIPSIIAMVVVGTNANIDGFFIGGILGDDGLAAINIAWPIVAVICSIGTGIGIGGSVVFNRVRGEGDLKTAERIKNTTLALLFISGILIGALSYAFAQPLLILMGAEGEVLRYALDYAKVISAGAILPVVGSGLLVLLRNDEKTYQSMFYSLAGLLLHIGLNFLLADTQLMIGVGAATVLSQSVIVILGLLSLSLDRSAKPKLSSTPEILVNSIAPFGINFVPSMVLLLTNSFALMSGGVTAVSAYAAMSYAIYFFDYVFQGICDGIQPIISYCRGSGDLREERSAERRAAVIMVIFSAVCIALTPLLIILLPKILNVSEEARVMVESAFWIYAVSYPFKGAVKFISSYYYAAGQSKLSNILVYLDPLVITPISLYVLVKLCGTTGIWISMPLSQILLCVAAALIALAVKKRKAVK